MEENKARYDHYRLYRVHFTTDDQVRIFQELEQGSDSCIFLGHARKVGQKLTILVAAHKVADLTDLIKRFAVEHEILCYNFQEKIDQQWKSVKPKSTSPNDFNWTNYFHLDTIYAWLDKIAAEHSEIITPLNIGVSYEGRPIKGVKLSKRTGNTAVFVEGTIHAREWISPATATFILNELLTSADPDVQELSNNFDWYFFPIINPDGYAFTFDSDRMWRKTRQPNGLCCGADLNRNFDCHWNESGSSPDPSRYDYAGASVNSEPEAAVVSKFLTENRETNRIETYISLHSHSQLMMFPYGFNNEKPPNYNELLAIGQAAIKALEQRYGTQYKTGSKNEIIYPSSGSSLDWAYTALKIPVAFTLELRGPPDSKDIFILPANEITPCALETLDSLVAMLREAKNQGYYAGTK